MLAIRTIEARTHGRYVIDVPATFGPRALLVGFHGYGESAERHLEELRRIPGTGAWIVAAVQGLHRFYTTKTQDVVASWMTRQDREQAIADNIAYVDRVVADIAREREITRLVFAGFSQGVAMAFRAGLNGAFQAHGVIALGGDIPADVREGASHPWPAVLVGRGTRDTWYTTEKLEADRAFLASVGVPPQVVVFDGDHAWSDEFRAAAGAFLQRVVS